MKAFRVFLVLLLLAALSAGAWWVWQRRQHPRTEQKARNTATPLAASRPTPAPTLPAPVRPEPAVPAPVRFQTESTAPHGRLDGRVVSSADGKGVPFAQLTFLSGQSAHAVTAGSNGSFTFEPPATGRYDLASVTADGYLPFASAWGQSPVTFMARRSERIRGATVALTPAVDYTGRVVDPQGNPVAGARVKVSAPGDTRRIVPGATFRSGDDGTFTFQAGDWATLEATHPRFSPGQAVVDFRAQVSRKLTLVLRPRGQDAPVVREIAGQVLLPSGVPAPGARVTAQATGKRPGESVTDIDGHFRLTELEDTTYRLRARLDGYTPAEVASVRAGTPQVVLELGTGARIEGTVRNVEGELVQAFTVVVETQTGPLTLEPYTVRSVYDSSGTYAVTGMEPGTYRITALGEGYAPVHHPDVVVESEETQTVDFELFAGGRIEGAVTHVETNTPIVGARVTVEGGAGNGQGPGETASSVTTGEDGVFELTGIEPGTRSIQIVAEGHHVKIVSDLEVHEDETTGPIAIELTPVAEDEEPKIELVGIGAVLTAVDDVLEVTEVVEGGGAAEAEIAVGDRIEAVDGTPVVELGFEGAINKIRGAPNTVVVLRVVKSGTEGAVDVEVTRRKIRT